MLYRMNVIQLKVTEICKYYTTDIIHALGQSGTRLCDFGEEESSLTIKILPNTVRYACIKNLGSVKDQQTQQTSKLHQILISY